MRQFGDPPLDLVSSLEDDRHRASDVCFDGLDDLITNLPQVCHASPRAM
jgi:hypothetical protein